LLKPQALDAKKIQADFPILKRKVNGKRLVYLDNAATTQKPQQVINALVDYYSKINANVHRSVHRLGEESTEAFEGSRAKVAGLIGGKPEEVVFTRGTTESINLVRFAWGEKEVREGDTLVATLMEHHSNLVPWQLLAKKTGANLKLVGLNPDGSLKMDEMEKFLNDSPKLVAVTHCSNVVGTINDVAKICAEARKAGAVSVVDGAQAVPHMPVDLKQIGCDFYAFSGHKMLGPTGIGVLYGRRALLESIDPFQAGGEMIREVFNDHATWNEVPYKFEAGTVNIADAVGLGAAVDYLEGIGMEKVREHEIRLLKYAMEVLPGVKGLTVYGPREPERRGDVLAFNLGDVHPHDVATILDEEGIAIRSGHHCAQPLMRWLDVAATNRASFYVYNDTEDIDALAAGLEKVRRVFHL